MNRILITLLLVAFFFVLGCQDGTEPREEYWEPSSEQIVKAEVVAQEYAEVELKVPKDILGRVKSSVTGFYQDGNKIIYMEFFDPNFFPNWEDMGGMLGGFPHYYCISIDFEKMKVVGSYASSE